MLCGMRIACGQNEFLVPPPGQYFCLGAKGLKVRKHAHVFETGAMGIDAVVCGIRQFPLPHPFKYNSTFAQQRRINAQWIRLKVPE